MPSSSQSAGVCPQCHHEALICRFNFFDRGDLQVHSWEHKCTNCGWRQTEAYRSDAPPAANVNADVCPWCNRRGI